MDNNIRERIDRGVANDAWIQLFPSFSLRHLLHSFSDHCPLLIETEVRGRKSRIDCFRFEAWWALEDSCEVEVKKLWESSLDSFPTHMLAFAKGLQKRAKLIKSKRGRHVK